MEDEEYCSACKKANEEFLKILEELKVIYKEKNDKVI